MGTVVVNNDEAFFRFFYPPVLGLAQAQAARASLSALSQLLGVVNLPLLATNNCSEPSTDCSKPSLAFYCLIGNRKSAICALHLTLGAPLPVCAIDPFQTKYASTFEKSR